MHVIDVRNVHKALPEGLRLLERRGSQSASRNGRVVKLRGPVTTLYRQPTERVMFWPERDANPFFHLYESLWMLAGRRDVAGVAHYVKRMRDFSDDGKTFHGAYGFRWRRHFDIEGGGADLDQLSTIVRLLRTNPEDRRVVLTMWDPIADLGRTGKDFPCNTQAYFNISEGELDMEVNCRSNDVVWGAYGANAVHFSMLQEFLAGCIGVPVGRYWQVSFNYHGYPNTMEPVRNLADRTEDHAGHRPCPYERGLVEPYPIMSVDQTTWEQDLGVYLTEGPITGFREPFFRQVVTPMHHAHAAYKMHDYDAALDIIAQCQATDWRMAAREWLERRRQRHARAADDGVHA
jgi:hypothetical protein